MSIAGRWKACWPQRQRVKKKRGAHTPRCHKEQGEEAKAEGRPPKPALGN